MASKSVSERISKDYARMLRRGHSDFINSVGKPVSLIEYTRLLAHVRDIPTRFKKKPNDISLF